MMKLNICILLLSLFVLSHAIQSQHDGDNIKGEQHLNQKETKDSDDPEIQCPEGYKLKSDLSGKQSCVADNCASAPCLNGGTCVVMESSSSYMCKCSSLYSGKNCDKDQVTNLASAQCGANCSASSILSPEYDCIHSLDGYINHDLPVWGTNYEREGAWIRVNFDDYYLVHGLMIFDRPNLHRSTRSIAVDMSSGEQQVFDCLCMDDVVTGYFWQRFDLQPTVTDHIRVQITAACLNTTTEYMGFRGLKVIGYDVPMVNVATLSSGATCDASSEYHDVDFSCDNAIDEVDEPGLGTEWASDNEGSGAWIQINLPTNQSILAVGFLQRCDQIEQNKILTLQDRDGTQQVELVCFNTGMNPMACEDQYWQHFALDREVYTDSLRITITTTCTQRDNGFREIRIFALREELLL